MAKFIYKAKSFDGRTETGILEAQDERQLAQQLKRDNLMLIEAILEQAQKKSPMEIKLPFFGISLAEKIMLVKNMGIMFATGLSLVKIFDILSTQSRNKQLKDTLSEIKEKINKGESLSDALSHYPKIFSDIFVNMVKIGEESGTLDNVFQMLSLQLGKEHELKSKIKNAMIYPSMILMVIMGVGVVMVTFVLPNLSTFFGSLNVDLPIYTRLFLSAGDFLSTRWYLLFVIPAVIAGGLYALSRTRPGKQAIDTILLRVPVVSAIVKKSNSAFLVRSLSSLIASGVPLTRSLEIASKTVRNHYFKEAILDASIKIKKGDKLSAALKSHLDIFPFGVVEMIEVGEETGETADILKKLADFYEQEAGSAIERMSILIEPILIIGLGIGVGFFAFSIIGPMYSSLKFVNE